MFTCHSLEKPSNQELFVRKPVNNVMESRKDELKVSAKTEIRREIGKLVPIRKRRGKVLLNVDHRRIRGYVTDDNNSKVQITWGSNVPS